MRGRSVVVRVGSRLGSFTRASAGLNRKPASVTLSVLAAECSVAVKRWQLRDDWTQIMNNHEAIHQKTGDGR